VAAPLRDQVVQILREEIGQMRMLPGQRLVERDLIERIGVSRTTIREALRELAAGGLVETVPQKGAIVAVPSEQEAAEVYEVRELLEGLAARQFVDRASEDAVISLRQAYVGIRESSVGGGDSRALLQAKNHFYEVLFDGAGNHTIRSILGGLHSRVTALRAMSLSAPGRRAQSLEEIGAIVDAVERRDADAAERASSRHVQQAARVLFAALDEERAAEAVGAAANG
jgi:DNA-binding GntR family transcriptional regulator